MSQPTSIGTVMHESLLPPTSAEKANGKAAPDAQTSILGTSGALVKSMVDPRDFEEKIKALESDARRIHEAEDLEALAGTSQQKYLTSKEETRELKKQYEADVDRLRKRIRDKNDLLPFEPQPGKGKDDGGFAQDEEAGRDKAAFDAATLDDLGIIGKLAEKLDADGIKSGKDLQEWFGQHPQRKIAGVGQGQIDKINEAMAAFYEERRVARETKGKTSKGRKTKPVAGTNADADAISKERGKIFSLIRKLLERAKRPQTEFNEMSVLASADGVTELVMRQRLEAITLKDLKALGKQVKKLKVKQVKAIFD